MSASHLTSDDLPVAAYARNEVLESQEEVASSSGGLQPPF